MKIDIVKLRQKTAEAIAAGEEAERIIDLQKEQERQNERRLKELKVREILDSVAEKCELQASKGHSHAEICDVDYIHVDRNGYDPNITITNIENDVICMVYNALNEAGLNPYFESWDDGCGMKGGWHLCVKW